MGGIGSYFTQHAQQAQQALPENMQPDQSRSMNYGGSPGGNVNPYQNYGSHSVAYPGQSPQDWLAMQQGTSIHGNQSPMWLGGSPPGSPMAAGGRGYSAWPGQGFGGMPGRFAGAYNRPGYYGGGPSGYGFGGGGFGYGGYSPFGYGPGSFSPWSAGSMGYGGGSGMMGGPQRPFTGFNYGNLLQSMGAPSSEPGRQAPIRPYDPMNLVSADMERQIRQLQNQVRSLQNPSPGRSNIFGFAAGGGGEGGRR